MASTERQSHSETLKTIINTLIMAQLAKTHNRKLAKIEVSFQTSTPTLQIDMYNSSYASGRTADSKGLKIDPLSQNS